MTTWVLLRGLARESRHWEGFDAAMRATFPGDAVVAPDLPGNGQLWREASPLSVSAMLACARAQLAAAAHAPPYVPVALSLGGMVAMQWAREHPRELAGCVLVNTSAAGASPPWQRLRPGALAAMLAILRPGLAQRERERRIVGLTTNLRADRGELAGRWAAYAGQSPVARANAVRQLVAALRFRAPRSRLAVPLLVLASQGDRVVSAQCSLALARRWGAAVRLHPHAGHDLPLDDGPWVLAQLHAWRAALANADGPASRSCHG